MRYRNSPNTPGSLYFRSYFHRDLGSIALFPRVLIPCDTGFLKCSITPPNNLSSLLPFSLL